MTGDDHGNGGTVGRFNQYKALSAPGCSVADWQCIRSTSYIYNGTPGMDDAASLGVRERRLRSRAPRDDRTARTGRRPRLPRSTRPQLAQFHAERPSVPRASDQPHALHRRGATTSRSRRWSSRTASGSTRTTTSTRRTGCRTGPASSRDRPCRCASPTSTASTIDVYQAATQMTDESGQTYPFTAGHAARSRARAARLLRRVHGEHAHRSADRAAVGRDRGVGDRARRAGRVGASRCSTGSTAATARRSGRSPGTRAR